MTTLPPYYDIKSWLLTNETMEDYSKINEINHISSCKQDIKHNDRLLLLEFLVLKDIRSSGYKYIAHDLRIIRVVKNGEIFCKSLSFIYAESIERTDGMISKRIYPDTNVNRMGVSGDDILNVSTVHSYSAPNGLIINSPLYEQFETYPNINKRVLIYTVRLYNNDLLNDIKKQKQKQKQLPSLFQLCFYTIVSNELEQYNDIHRV